jgi:hypothetical protein
VQPLGDAVAGVRIRIIAPDVARQHRVARAQHALAGLGRVARVAAQQLQRAGDGEAGLALGLRHRCRIGGHHRLVHALAQVNLLAPGRAQRLLQRHGAGPGGAVVCRIAKRRGGVDGRVVRRDGGHAAHARAVLRLCGARCEQGGQGRKGFQERVHGVLLLLN